MFSNPKLYEINTRVWIKQFDRGTKLTDIPSSIWKSIADTGINAIWLLGIWLTCPEVIDKYCFSADLVSSYSRSLPDWKKEDVIGSPFSINDYSINPELGSWTDIRALRTRLNGLGLKLILDFIPNHFSSCSSLLESNPEIFLRADKELNDRDPFTFFKDENSGEYFAHGRDPLFPAWTDTAQINYFNNEAREYMIGNLLKLADICDGVRCDMAMLPLNNVFENTWLGVLNKNKYSKPDEEFWKIAIEKVKKPYPEFIFIAEAYWDLEWDLQQLGFDFTYDKRLTDRLAAYDLPGVKAHLQADTKFQKKSIRFLENHDELRAVTKFGKKQSFAASVLVSTLQGMKLYYDGQFDGKRIRLPVQLGREPEEKISKSLNDHYKKILGITKHNVFNKGEWLYIEPEPVSSNNFTSEFIFAWLWKLNNDNRLVVINYSQNVAYCRLKFDPDTDQKELILTDLINGENYKRNTSEIKSVGLFIELKCYHSHIFSFSV